LKRGLISAFTKNQFVKTYRNNMAPVPLWISKVNESSNRHEKVERELENFEVWTTHGAVWDEVLEGPQTLKS
jgi:hypothetical protein